MTATDPRFLPSPHPTGFSTWVWLTVGVAYLLRVYLAFIFPEITADELVQLVSAKQFALGHGISLVTAQPKDLSQFVYEPLDKWPPGFALAVGGLIKGGFSFFIANFLVDVVGITAFFLGWVLLFHSFGKSLRPGTQVLFFAFIGVSFMPWRILATTDLVSLGFCFLSLALLVLILQKTKSPNLFLWACLLALTAFLSSFFRFAYYPLTLLIPFLLILWPWLINRKINWVGVWACCLTVLFLVGLQLFIYYQRQAISYLPAHHPVSEQVWFPENLLKINPVLANAFFYDLLIQVKVGPTFGRIFTWVVSLLLLLVFFLMAKPWLKRENFFENIPGPSSAIRIFVWSMGAVTVTVFLFLAGLALMLAPIPARWTSDGFWTYVEETRYYAPVFIFMGFMLVMATNEKWVALPEISRNLARVLLGSSMVFSMGTWGYYATRYSLSDGPANMRQYYAWSDDLPVFLAQERLGASVLPVVFVPGTASSWIEMFFTLEGAAPLENADLPAERFQTAAPVKVLFALEKDKQDPISRKVQRLISLHQATLLTHISDMDLEIWEAIVLPEQ